MLRWRFVRGRENLGRLYATRVDVGARYDNTGIQPVLLDLTEKSLKSNRLKTPMMPICASPWSCGMIDYQST
jgi:hypothetical protein